jgi:uncharacterized membrane protein
MIAHTSWSPQKCQSIPPLMEARLRGITHVPPCFAQQGSLLAWVSVSFAPFRSHLLPQAAHCTPSISQNFSLLLLQTEERWKFNPSHISHLLSIWGKVSSIDGTLSTAQLNKLVRSLCPPIGTGSDSSKEQAYKFLEELDVKQVAKGRYTFEHTVFALVARVAEVPLPRSLATTELERGLAGHFLKVRMIADAVTSQNTQFAIISFSVVTSDACVVSL